MVPTPDRTPAPGNVHLECTVPAGVAAVVRLPYGTYGVKGPTADAAVVRSAAEGGAAAAAGGVDANGGPADNAATRKFRIHPGTWTFTPKAA
ncbi:hypothetical protein, partial [Arthrobacter sp. Cr_A7]|uniref:hypothetical protein n=1 Tax=Arthrobacter sp. Cr_A7 TaxID=3031017 RepID=UPI0023DC1971